MYVYKYIAGVVCSCHIKTEHTVDLADQHMYVLVSSITTFAVERVSVVFTLTLLVGSTFKIKIKFSSSSSTTVSSVIRIRTVAEVLPTLNLVFTVALL